MFSKMTMSMTQRSFFFGKLTVNKNCVKWTKHVIDRPGAIISLRQEGEISYGKSSLTIRQGDMIVYEALPRHDFTGKKDWSYCFFHMPEAMIEEIRKCPVNTAVPGVWSVHLAPAIFTRVKIELLEAGSCKNETLATALIQLILTRFLLQLPHEGKINSSRLNNATHILEGLERNVNMVELARQCGMSKTDFFRKFRLTFGCSPMEYRTNLIIGKAQRLLVSTSYQVQEIAEMLHFQDPYYFSRYFQKHTGKTPTQYRKNARK